MGGGELGEIGVGDLEVLSPIRSTKRTSAPSRMSASQVMRL